MKPKVSTGHELMFNDESNTIQWGPGNLWASTEPPYAQLWKCLGFPLSWAPDALDPRFRRPFWCTKGVSTVSNGVRGTNECFLSGPYSEKHPKQAHNCPRNLTKGSRKSPPPHSVRSPSVAGKRQETYVALVELCAGSSQRVARARSSASDPGRARARL